MAWPRWRHMLDESERQMLHALDCYNSSTGDYSDFIVHSHIAWLYLLQAELRKDGVDYHYADASGAYALLDGEPKAWDLATCIRGRYLEANPVRKNLELFIALRNKIEHRHERALQIATGGRAHALVINYDAERVRFFGSTHSISDKLRFPISVSSITEAGSAELRRIARTVPRRTSAFLAQFDAGLSPETRDDPRYDYRIRLVPIIGSKTEADLALDFVNLNKLDPTDRDRLVNAGREGTVITKTKRIDVARPDCQTAGRAAKAIEVQLPFRFTQYQHTQAWRKLHVRPARGAADPSLTDPEYCIFDEPFRQYVYTPAWRERLVRELSTADGYRAFFGSEPRPKVASRSVVP